MRVLILVDNLVSGGMQRRLLELLKGLKEYPDIALKVVVFSDEIHFKEILELDIPLEILSRKPKQNPMIFFKVMGICKRWQPDLMHTWGTMSAIWSIPAKLWRRIPLLNGNIVNAPAKLNIWDKRYFRARLTYPFSTRIIGNSQAGLQVYKVPKQKALCIYNGFDFNRLNKLKPIKTVQKEIGLKTEKAVGMVGMFTDKKDFLTLIKSGMSIMESDHTLSIICIGDGPNLESCKELVPSTLRDRFLFTGKINDVESVVQLFDIGVLMTDSQVHGEGISNAIIEYMAQEKPVIASIGGGTNEIVIDGETGILVPSKSISDLTKNLQMLLNDPGKRAQMGQSGKQRISEVFELNKMTDTYYQLYRSFEKN